MAELQHNVELFVQKRDLWRISGWVGAADRPVRSVAIVFEHDGVETSRPLALSAATESVAGNAPRALTRYLGFGRLDPSWAVKHARLRVVLDDGTSVTVDVTRFRIGVVHTGHVLRSKLGTLRRLLRQRRLEEIWTRGTALAARMATDLATNRSLSRHIARAARPAALIVDHSMGGGANLFRERLRQRLLEAGEDVFTLLFSLDRMSFVLDYASRGAAGQRIVVDSLAGLGAVLAREGIAAIYLNNTVSYPASSALLQFVLKQKSAVPSCTLEVMVHDFYSVCPSFSLINAADRFCDIPVAAICDRDCLPRHQNVFVLGQETRSIEAWRADWAHFLAAATQIRFFSAASRTLFLKAFPQLAQLPHLVEPHEQAALPAPVPLRPDPKRLRVAIVGSLNLQKGAGVVAALAAHIAEQQLAIDLVIVGSIDRPMDWPSVTVTGPYARQNLAAILARQGVGVGLFPAIGPETFSFVLSELGSVGLPVVGFDVGAQGERLRESPRNAVLPLGASSADIVTAVRSIALQAGRTAPGRGRSRIAVFTSAATNYLPKAMALAESVRRLHPEVDLFYCLSDRIDPQVDYHRGLFDDVVEAEALGIERFAGWSFRHSLVELSTAIKPFMMLNLLAQGYERVLYLDPDIVLFSRLDDLLAAGDRHAVLLTPHLTAAESEYEAILDNEISSLKHGTYNLGFVGVSNGPVGRQFAAWWANRTYEWCRDDIPNGLFTDQKWIDLVPALFPDVGILRQPRFNVSTWNLTQRRLEGDLDTGLRVNGEPLGFYHFTGFDSGAHRIMAAKNSHDNPAVMALVDWYEAKVRTVADDPAAKVKWAFGSYRDGTPVPAEHRRLYRSRPDLQAAFPEPFDSTPNSGLRRWLAENGEMAKTGA